MVDEIEFGALQGTGYPVLLRAYADWVEAEVLWRSGQRKASLEKFETFIDGPSGLRFLDNYARQLNERPRKTLQYQTPDQTPAEKFAECVAAIG